MNVEFSRPTRLDQIGAGESKVEIHAEPAERAALAQRFGMVSVERLDAQFALHRGASGIIARGRVLAEVTQACVVTDEPLLVRVDEPFAIRFVPEPEDGAGGEDELELSEDECDTVFFTGGTIDLGEAAAETLALGLDPYPRSPNAAAVLREAGVISEDEAKALAQSSGPFGGLAALKDKLSNN
ncbi:YceD family protein [Sphingomonas xinjiangensis]|uniref:Uncharacterized metal-binding protein YceD (DUF177 family) n=1 Tax=Sphingomonas xinjiangensis TaxID=643568 RepID=A0A840YES3_9SPHN|nr:DUF177 domain-containing protein [Sphingomonas xinjiangensis]MBB5711957.1 uncharacterized metal-binding protein YceD (DUF177 family) [Sphingomonas xinjiangensis]